MKTPPQNLLKQNRMILIFLIVVLLSTCSTHHPLAKATIFPRSSSSSNIQLSLKPLILDGNLSFENIHEAAKDFGNIYHFLPSAILYPETVSDISTIIKNINEMGTTSGLTVAARGNGHSVQGQAQAYRGIVIDMKSLRGPEMQFYTGELPYVDVSGGELWSWTDFLRLTVGGTLSNAGISGQAFRHGPQINNVYQLEVVTGTGEVVTCSEKQKTDLFYGVLGGLGQFGIITRARISLEPAPIMVKKLNNLFLGDKPPPKSSPPPPPPVTVKWIRVLYSDFSIFTKDQEHLISSQNAFDYIEGFVIINRTDLVNSWRSTFNPKDPVQASQFISDGKTLFCLEMAKYFNPQEIDFMNQKVDSLLSELSYIEFTLFLSEVSYVEFLDRLHVSMLKLQEMGLWDHPHPWLSLIIPRSRIHEFAQEVEQQDFYDHPRGRCSIPSGVPILCNAMFHRDRWLRIHPQPKQKNSGFLQMANLGVKKYLPHYLTQEEWKIHFGYKWEVFLRRKSTYDPLAILAPGQTIFKKGKVSQ
ncbi:unnamed protein product [Ilex paraguariensis]|uniref:cytokinin dehydrogenase n=1 Tax=Ilex paraguariensis TaxID=185542 RepID=A0ABC8US93_9AQUA